jgi:hypothetical protein
MGMRTVSFVLKKLELNTKSHFSEARTPCEKIKRGDLRLVYTSGAP